MNYEIVATLGPASYDQEIWQEMLAAGVTAFRLNTSHLSLPQLHQWLDRLGPFLSAVAPPRSLILDLQGSKWRLGNFETRTLVEGQAIEFVCADSVARPNVLPVPHPDFFQAAPDSNGKVVLNDARVSLVTETFTPDSLRARVVQGGEISSRKGITFAASTFRKESLNERDQAIVEQTRHLAFVHYALSYVRDAVEMSRYRSYFGRTAYLIAKLERQPAIDEATLITESADELWLCRGDLGAELGIQALAHAVYRFSAQLNSISAPVLMAGQVLEHMTEHPTPTRSEVCYLYDVLQNGYRGLVLSDETAIGRHPVESCRVAAMFSTFAG